MPTAIEEALEAQLNERLEKSTAGMAPTDVIDMSKRMYGEKITQAAFTLAGTPEPKLDVLIAHCKDQVQISFLRATGVKRLLRVFALGCIVFFSAALGFVFQSYGYVAAHYLAISFSVVTIGLALFLRSKKFKKIERLPACYWSVEHAIKWHAKNKSFDTSSTKEVSIEEGKKIIDKAANEDAREEL